MATKIINVLKDDKFQDILDIFRKTPAQEVIFVLPKKHKALAKEGDFEILSTAAEEQSKNVLILASNPEVNNLALEYSFGVLASEKSESKPKKKRTELPEAEPEPELEEVVQTPQEPDEDTGVEDEKVLDDIDDADDNRWGNEGGAQAYYRREEPYLSEVELTAVRKPAKIMSDIINPSREGEKVKMEVSKKAEHPVEVNIKQEPARTNIDPVRSLARAKGASPKDLGEATSYGVDEIENVWQRPAVQIKPPSKQADISRSWPIKKERRRFSLNLSRKGLTFLGTGVVALFAVVLYISTGSAQMTVKLRAYPLDLNLKVSASDKFLSIDPELKRIPGQLFRTEKNIEETFQATGEKDVVQKARGKLTVYNEYGTTPQVLIATTRFESEKGLIFRTLQTITVPGTKVQNGNIIPGSIEVDVIADKAGDLYNIAPGKLTIPAFKEKGDADRHQKFYGVSTLAMKGGIIGKAKVVTEADYINAKKKMEERIISETEEELKTQAAGLKILEAPQPLIKEITSTAQIDEAADDFTLLGKAELEIVGFKESDLHALIADYVGKINDLAILPEKLNLEFKDIKFNKEEKTLGFSVFIKGSAYSRVNKDKMISDLIGKNEGQIKDYLKGIEGVLSAKVVLSPFWVRKVPSKQERIKFELQYE